MNPYLIHLTGPGAEDAFVPFTASAVEVLSYWSAVATVAFNPSVVPETLYERIKLYTLMRSDIRFKHIESAIRSLPHGEQFLVDQVLPNRFSLRHKRLPRVIVAPDGPPLLAERVAKHGGERWDADPEYYIDTPHGIIDHISWSAAVSKALRIREAATA